MLMELALVVGAYLLGSVPTAWFVVRMLTGRDVRREGSGNVGATNAVRLAGWRAGIAVTVVDISKGAIPMLVMRGFNPASRWLAAVLVASVVGHCFPLWLRFRGGKGVATGFGAFVVLAPVASLAAFGMWLVILLLSRYVALASMLASALFPVVLFVLDHPPPVLLGAVSMTAVLIIARHASNMRNLIAGDEPRIGKNGPVGGGDA